MPNANSVLLSLPVASQGEATKPKRKPRVSKRITMRQASNMMDAVAFARQIGAPLNAHATIHWAGTKIGDDPGGRLFAKVREGFDKWLMRQGIPGGLSAIWVRERRSGGQAEVEHSHMLFHLPHPYKTGRKYDQIVHALERLIDRHGEANYLDGTLKLTFPDNPNGIYLLKGGGRDVWRKHAVPSIWREPQGVIFGKRCGVTENLGPAARKQLKERKVPLLAAA
jgi:hypothetical protein